MEPVRGVEPLTCGLRNRCSTTELHRPEAVEIIANGSSLEGLTKEETIIVRDGRELMDDHQGSQEIFDAALAQFGEANTIVLGALMGYYSFISCTLLGTDMRQPEGSPVLPKPV